MTRKQTGLLVVIGLIATLGLTTTSSAQQKAKNANNQRVEIVNLAKGTPSHVLLKPKNTFDPKKATVSASYKGSDGKTGSFTGVVRIVDSTNNRHFIRLKCTSETHKKPKDTTTGTLTVTLTQCGVCPENIAVDVTADIDPDACP
jgi:hypothetical protein